MLQHHRALVDLSSSKHPTELIVALLDKVMKSSVLRSNISSKRYLLLLDRPNGGLEVSIGIRR